MFISRAGSCAVVAIAGAAYLKNMLMARGIHSTNVRAVSTGASLENVKHGVNTK
jgi:hypothetical protein